eukprot:2967163-Rhodomonas_salina.1
MALVRHQHPALATRVADHLIQIVSQLLRPPRARCQSPTPFSIAQDARQHNSGHWGGERGPASHRTPPSQCLQAAST